MKSEPAPKISVVIPVYRSQDCLEELCRRLASSLAPLTPDYEVLLIEDAGGDRSWDVIERLARSDARIKGIQFSRNFGQHYGITAGLDHAKGDWVVVMDDDLEDRPEEIPRLYAKAREGFDVVLARGKRSEGLKAAASVLFYKALERLSDIPLDGDVGNFRILSRRVVENFKLMRERLRFFGGLMGWLGFPTGSVEVRRDPSRRGRTRYTPGKLFKLAVEAMIAYSDKPLRLAVGLGFFISTVAMAAGAWLLVRALVRGSPVMGWPSLIVSLYFLGGLIIAILGVIGIYLGKTFDETKRRPLYVVLRKTFDEIR